MYDELIEKITALRVGERLSLDLDPETYHKLPFISSGFVRSMDAVGEYTTYATYVARTMEKPDSDALRLGRVFHLAATDPVGWREHICVVPSHLQNDHVLRAIRLHWMGRTKKLMEPGEEIDMKSPAHKAYIEAHRAEATASGRQWITEQELANTEEQIEAVLENRETARVVGNPKCVYEKTCFYRDPRSGLVLKAMADVVFGEESLVVDFKTSRWNTADQFIRAAIYDYAIPVQMAHYTRTWGLSHAAIISVRNFRPTEALWFDVSKWRMDEATKTLDDALRRIKECMSVGHWHSLGHGERLLLA